jgi:hypothetical protein
MKGIVKGTVEIGSSGMIHIPNVVKIDAGVQAILRFSAI